ncbi:MAG: hypothetical protein KIT68_01840 [Phycisphaeraceae bacterium]|nr:hypothetical protein [Phycisphaeraceae bacterium]
MSLLERYRDMPEDQRKRLTLIVASVCLVLGVTLVAWQLLKSEPLPGTPAGPATEVTQEGAPPPPPSPTTPGFQRAPGELK